MSDLESNFEVKIGSERNFGVVFAGVFAAIALWPLLKGSEPRWIVLALAAIFLALALTAPSLLRTPNRLWFQLGLLLGAIVAPVFMGLVFLFAFVPIGMLVRASGKDLLSLEMNPEAESYWIIRETAPGTMKLQY